MISLSDAIEGWLKTKPGVHPNWCVTYDRSYAPMDPSLTLLENLKTIHAANYSIDEDRILVYDEWVRAEDPEFFRKLRGAMNRVSNLVLQVPGVIYE